jgi:hypothetical protein
MDEWILSLCSEWKACTANLMFFIAAYSIGRIIVATLWRKDKLTTTILSIIVGTNLMAVMFFLLTITGVCRFIPPFCFVFLCSVPLIFDLLKKCGKETEIKRPAISPGLIFFLVVVLILMGASLSPPIGWDEMVYHQSIVRRWIADGFPYFYPDLPYSAFPSSNSFIYWMLTDTGTVIAPRLFIWCCWVFTLLIFFKILKLYSIDDYKAILILLAFALSKTMLIVVSDAYVETLILMNSAGIFLVIADKISNTETAATGFIKSAILCGIMAGGAASIKLTGIILFVIPALWSCFLYSHFPSARKNILKATILFFSVGLLIALPFYLRPWFATGNPFYPYFCWLFSDSQAQMAMSEFHHKIGAKFGHNSLIMFLAAPLALAFNGNTFDGNFGLQFLMIFVFAVFAFISIRKKEVHFWASASIILYLFWFLTSQQARFILPLVFMLYICAAIFISQQKKIWQWGIITILAMLMLISLPFNDSGYYYYSWSQLIGRTKKTDYVNTGTSNNFLPGVDAVMHLTPENSKLMVLFEHRILYIPRKTVIATPYFQEKYFTPIENYTSDSVLENEIVKSEAEYLLVAINPEGPDELPEYLEKQKEFIRRLSSLVPRGKLKEIWRSQQYSLFKIIP